MMRHWTNYLFHLCLLLLLAACKDDPQPQPEVSYDSGVFVVNEGNFQGGNASLSFLRRGVDTIANDIFTYEVERPLGDVAQSIAIAGSRAYIVVNNSGKIEVVDLPGFTSRCTITGMQSPRYLLPIGGGRALVTDLYARAIHVVDLNACAVTGSIPTGGWTEEMRLIGSEVWVTQTGTDKLLVVDPATTTLTDSVYVGREPNSMVVDSAGKLWVLCGNALGQSAPQLVRLDPATRTVERSWQLGTGLQAPARLVIDAAGERLFWINAGVYRMSVGDTTIPAQPFIPVGSGAWYGLDIDPVSGNVYVTDARDFQHNGVLYRYDQNSGVRIGTWAVGMIPGEMGFWN